MLPVNHTGGIRDAGGISRHQGCCVGNRQPSWCDAGEAYH